MPALIDLRRRIKSVRNTQQITQAMKTVSTAKFKKAQNIVLESRIFWHRFPDFLKEVACWADQSFHPLLARRKEKSILALVITSDKGLCGAFNSNLLAAVNAFFQEKTKTAEVRLILFGKKAVDFFKKHEYHAERAYKEDPKGLNDESLRELSEFLIRDFCMGRMDAVYVAYNEFKSILAPQITVSKLLPIEPPEQENCVTPPDWMPVASNLVRTVLPQYVESQIRHFVFESNAAEHAARMMAMDNATRNAEELIEDLTLVMNKIRQASITKELLEIMTAVEALSKNR